jgi:hypothetical protein
VDFPALLRRFEQARNNRANWNTIWQDIADRVWPTMSDFTQKRTDGAVRTEKMLDSTAALAAQRALAAITSFFWPSNQRYQKLAEDAPKPDVNRSQVNQAVSVYLDAQTETLFRARYSPQSSFEAQMSEAGMSFLVFGTGILFIDDMLEDPSIRRPGILYKSVPLAQTYLEENAAGKIDTLHRCWPWTLRQVEQRFPGKLPERLARRLETHPDEKIDIAQTVCPRQDYDTQGVGGTSMPWASVYYIPGEKALLEEGGFRCWPFAIMRYMTSSGEVYGRSPAWLAMSNIRTLNTMKRTTLAAAQKVADPTMLTTEDGILGAFSNAPGAMVFGGLNENGQELVKPLQTGGNVSLSLEMMDKERDIVSSAFFLDVFKALVENPQMTATQALELMQERATLMAPIGGRIESEGLGPMTERELDILGHAGQLDPMPQELVSKNGAYKIVYTSPMRQAMRASEAIAITRSLEQILPLAQEDPSVLDVFQSLALVARELCEINGVPAKLLNDMGTIVALKDQRTQQANAAAAVQAAPQISAAAKNLTQMQAAGGRPQI